MRPRLSVPSKVPKLFLVVRAPHRDLLLLHLAEQPLDPSLELSFEFRAVHYHDHRRIAELLLAFQDQPRGSEQGEGLAGALRVPDQPAPLLGLGATLDDQVDGVALVLAQHRLPCLTVFDVEQDPVAQRAQEVGRLEERLNREAVALLPPFLPARHEAAGGVPGHPVPVVQHMGDVEDLRRCQQLRCLGFVPPQLRDPALDRAGVLRIPVLDDRHGHAVHHEHHVRAVPLASRRLEPPLPRDVQGVGARCLEVDRADVPVTCLCLVIPLPLPAQPGEHVTIAFDGGRDRFDRLHRRADGILGHPRIEPAKGACDLAPEQRSRLPAAPAQRFLRR